MKLVLRLGMALLAAAVLAAPGGAGVNVNGVLYVHTDDGVTYTTDQGSYCGMMSGLACPDEPDCPYPNACDVTFSRFNPTSGKGAGETAVFWVLAAFPHGVDPNHPCPRLKAVNFAIDYNMSNDPNDDDGPVGLVVVASGPCAEFELPGTDPVAWPEPGSNTSLVWDSPQRTPLAEVYWFATYSYPTGNPLEQAQLLTLRADPNNDIGFFADDSVPSILDDISDYGEMGLGGAPGTNPQTPTPALETTWGRIKTTYSN